MWGVLLSWIWGPDLMSSRSYPIWWRIGHFLVPGVHPTKIWLALQWKTIYLGLEYLQTKITVYYVSVYERAGSTSEIFRSKYYSLFQEFFKLVKSIKIQKNSISKTVLSRTIYISRKIVLNSSNPNLCQEASWHSSGTS
jgi:hypothetical protein